MTARRGFAVYAQRAMRAVRARATGTLLAAMAAALALCGCGGPPQPVAARYLQALKLGNYRACYRLLSAQDRASCTLAQFVTEIPLAPDVSRRLFEPVLDHTVYVTGEARRAGKFAIVPVKVTTPELARWERMIDATVGSGGDALSAALDSLKSGDFPKVTYDDTFVMVRERRKWRIVADFATKERAAKERAAALIAYYNRRYTETINTYRTLIETLGRAPATGNQGLAMRYTRELSEITRTMERAPREQAYVSKVRLSGVAMKMAGDGMPGIFGTITNTGHQQLDQAVVRVTFYEGRGRHRTTLYSEEHVVLSVPLAFTDFASVRAPLLPGASCAFGFEMSAPRAIEDKSDPYVSVDAVTFTPPWLVAHGDRPQPGKPVQGRREGQRTGGSPAPQQTPAQPPTGAGAS